MSERLESGHYQIPSSAAANKFTQAAFAGWRKRERIAKLEKSVVDAACESRTHLLSESGSEQVEWVIKLHHLNRTLHEAVDQLLKVRTEINGEGLNHNSES